MLLSSDELQELGEVAMETVVQELVDDEVDDELEQDPGLREERLSVVVTSEVSVVSVQDESDSTEPAEKRRPGLSRCPSNGGAGAGGVRGPVLALRLRRIGVVPPFLGEGIVVVEEKELDGVKHYKQPNISPSEVVAGNVATVATSAI